MGRRISRLVACGLLAAASVAGIGMACSVADVDYAGKACPCPSGFTCVDDAGCQSTAAQPAGETSADSGDGFIQVTNLRALWTTPNVIRWTWDVSGSASNFGSYTLEVTSDNGDAGGVRTWTASDNAELGAFDLPDPFGGITPVMATMTDEHDPNTTYRAVLLATDTEGRVSKSNQAVALTGVVPANGKIVVFDGVKPAGGFLLPQPGAGIASGCGVDGGACFLLQMGDVGHVCAATFDAGLQCYVNLQFGFNTIDSSAVNLAEFTSNAYLEFYYRYDGAAPSYWSETWLQFVDASACADAQYCLWGLQPWSISHAQSYRRLQIPLRMLYLQTQVADSDAAATLAGFTSGLEEFALGGSWLANSSVSFDQVAVWY